MDCRSIVTIAWAGCAMLAPGAPVGAQQADHERHAEPGHSHGLHFAHPLVTESVSPDRKVRLNYVRTWEGDANADEIEVEGEWAFDRSFSIEVKVPYVSINPELGGARSALGTVEAALKFANFAFERHGLLLGYGLEFGLPTGDPVQGIGSDHVWEIEPFLNVGWQRRRVELVGWARFGIPTNQNATEEVETEFHYDLSGLFRVSPRVEALLELNGETGLSGPEDGVGVVTLSPGLKIAPIASRSLFVGISGTVPLGEQELDSRLGVSFLYHF